MANQHRHQTSLTSGSLIEHTKLPLTTWFLAIYLCWRGQSQWANSATASCSRQPSRARTRTAQHERRRFNTHSAPPQARAVQSNGIFCLPDAGRRRRVGYRLRAASARQKNSLL